jgi:hypothetical protein
MRYLDTIAMSDDFMDSLVMLATPPPRPLSIYNKRGRLTRF